MFGPINVQHAIEIIIILLISIDFHELAHAMVADRLHDPTPRRMGELSLNPFVHMDQIGVMLLLLTSISPLGFTYGRTHVTPANLKFGPQRGNALVAVAGPLTNLLLAVIIAIPLRLYLAGTITLSGNVGDFLFLALELNLLLFVLNLLPIPPLDGFSVLGGFLSARQMYSLAPIQQWGPVILLLLFVLNPYVPILGDIISPAMNAIAQVLIT
ncbi:MAG TPA: site-2 protease family protein [Chloroflexota bacterium]|nr:site-2 protease family protein [Chloroflexota bacterium]